MSGIMRHYRHPEWSTALKYDFAESVLAKTAEYNNSADAWRPLRPEDIPGATAGIWWNTVVIAAGIWTTMIPVAAGFRVPQGLGIGFYGFWISGQDLGRGAGYRVNINTVKRVEAPIHEIMADSHGARVGLAATHVGMVFYFHVRYEHPEQLVFAQENDIVTVQLYSEFAIGIGVIEFFPLAIVAGNGKQLLINA